MTGQKIALVTGANKGIGFEIAAGLGRLGWIVGVGARDDRRIVQRSQLSTIGWPGSPRPGAFPPSQAFTVEPTSANSPSCRAPLAFRPAT